MNMVQDFLERVKRTDEGNKKMRVSEMEMLDLNLSNLVLDDSWINRKWYEKEVRRSLRILGIELPSSKTKLQVVIKKLERRMYGN